MRPFSAALGVTALLATLPPSLLAQAPGYVVLAAVPASDPFDAAARVLAEHHHAPIVRFDPNDLEPLRAALTKSPPRFVALVMRPEQIDFVFQRRFLQLATEVDDDPFVDFAFGYLTGRTADEAAALARRGVARTPQPVDGGVAMVAGGVDRSFVGAQAHALRHSRLAAQQVYCAGEQAFADTGRDIAFLREQLPKLKGRDAVTFVGHGYPKEVVGGPTFAELAGIDLQGAVVLNVACYTGVTHRWFEDDWKAGVVRAREVPLDESFCLALLRTGVVGYTAYLCPRPAGPELDTDLAALVADGASLGEARRRDYDKTVLGFLGYGEQRLQLASVHDGATFPPNRDAVRDLMLEGATGGVLFGDPACTPFRVRKADSPVDIEAMPKDYGFELTGRVAAQSLYLHCADPTAEWGKTMAMRVYTRLPLGTTGFVSVTDVLVDSLAVGTQAQPSRVLWAVEDDQGKSFLHLKVNFPRGDGMFGDLQLRARVLTTREAAQGKRRGGEVRRPPVASPDVKSRELAPFLLAAAKAREVSPEAMQDALDAGAELFAGRSFDDAKLAAFRARGSEGFRAVCAMLDVGHSHFRTWELLKLTWSPGDERHLLALASGPDLPNWASWTVLRGLGVADTVEVRAYLTRRLAEETDAGMFMSVAQALAHLGAREALPAIARRVREFRPDWVGVAPHLVEAIATFGGAEAVKELETIVAGANTELRRQVLATIDRLDSEAGKRVRAAPGKGK